MYLTVPQRFEFQTAPKGVQKLGKQQHVQLVHSNCSILCFSLFEQS